MFSRNPCKGYLGGSRGTCVAWWSREGADAGWFAHQRFAAADWSLASGFVDFLASLASAANRALDLSRSVSIDRIAFFIENEADNARNGLRPECQRRTFPWVALLIHTSREGGGAGGQGGAAHQHLVPGINPQTATGSNRSW